MATWETPPPSSSRNTPPLMTVPFVKPFAVVRSPTVSFMLNVSPGSRIVPSMSSAARPWLMLRYSAYGKYVLNELTRSLILSFFGVGGGELRIDDLGVDLDAAGVAGLGDGGNQLHGHLLRLQADALLAGHDDGLAVPDLHRRVDGLLADAGGGVGERLGQLLRVDLRLQLVVLDADDERRRVGADRQVHLLLADLDDDGSADGGLGDRLHGLLEAVGVDRRLDDRGGHVDRARGPRGSRG